MWVEIVEVTFICLALYFAYCGCRQDFARPTSTPQTVRRRRESVSAASSAASQRNSAEAKGANISEKNDHVIRVELTDTLPSYADICNS